LKDLTADQPKFFARLASLEEQCSAESSVIPWSGIDATGSMTWVERPMRPDLNGWWSISMEGEGG
jgi:hypothetical protein